MAAFPWAAVQTATCCCSVQLSRHHQSDAPGREEGVRAAPRAAQGAGGDPSLVGGVVGRGEHFSEHVMNRAGRERRQGQYAKQRQFVPLGKDPAWLVPGTCSSWHRTASTTALPSTRGIPRMQKSSPSCG